MQSGIIALTRKLGVKNLKKFKIGLVNFTNTFIKKNSESSLWKMFIADLPISVYITAPNMQSIIQTYKGISIFLKKELKGRKIAPLKKVIQCCLPRIVLPLGTLSSSTIFCVALSGSGVIKLTTTITTKHTLAPIIPKRK